MREEGCSSTAARRRRRRAPPALPTLALVICLAVAWAPQAVRAAGAANNKTILYMMDSLYYTGSLTPLEVQVSRMIASLARRGHLLGGRRPACL